MRVSQTKELINGLLLGLSCLSAAVFFALFLSGYGFLVSVIATSGMALLIFALGLLALGSPRKDFVITFSIGLIVLTGGILLNLYNQQSRQRALEASSKSPSTSVDRNNFDAYYYSIEEVKKLLKAPGTAKFAPINETTINQNGIKFDVGGYVDAQNSFGVMLRQPYLCRIEFQTSDRYLARCELVGK